jgi:hypothetical protein
MFLSSSVVFDILLCHRPNACPCINIPESPVQNIFPSHRSMWLFATYGINSCSVFLLAPSVSRFLFSTILFIFQLPLYIALKTLPSLNCYSYYTMSGTSASQLTIAEFTHFFCTLNRLYQRFAQPLLALTTAVTRQRELDLG